MFWDGLGLIMYAPFAFAYLTSTAVFAFLSLIYSRGETASFLGRWKQAVLWDTHQSYNKIQIYDLGEWWDLRDDIHETVGSIAWIPHHRSNTQAGSIFCRQEVQSANAEQCTYRKISTRFSDATILVVSAPPLFWTNFKASQNLASLKKKKKARVWGIYTPPWENNI